MAEDSKDFIRERIDLERAADPSRPVATRFPPEPNGYLHIGHAKSICLNFGIARDYGGTCNLRFDDTNPEKEEQEYVDSIMEDIRWLGFQWSTPEPLYASDYFQRLYDNAEQLIRDGKAYVCSLSLEEIRDYRGSLTEAGRPSPFRDRNIDENLELFRAMRSGTFPDGAHVLRAKIDMAASNMKLRDPLLYRIRHVEHQRTGDEWCIYPMYDYAHPLSDAFENITHSICTLEFENNRPLYDWIVENSDVSACPKQIEFARLGLGYTVMSKRKLLRLVQDGHVEGWDDPRMPTIAGMRRRGYPPEAIRAFCDLIGVAKNNSTVDIGKLEYTLRNNLNHSAPRRMCVTDPIRLTISNYSGEESKISAPSFPDDVEARGSRDVLFSDRLLIEREDFSQNPPKGFRRLSPGAWVRLRYAFCVRCDEVVTDDDGAVIELKCSYDPESKGGKSPKGAEVAGTIHWVSEAGSSACQVRQYDRLFTVEKPDASDDFVPHLNRNSLRVLSEARVENAVLDDGESARYQFERTGYFARDRDSEDGTPVFNRIVTLRDSWSKKEKAGTTAAPKVTKSKKALTRPSKKSRAEQRLIAREQRPALAERYARYQKDFGLAESDADILSADETMGPLFEAVVQCGTESKTAAKWIVNEVRPEESELRYSAAHIAELIALVDSGTVSATVGKKVFDAMSREQKAPGEIIERDGLAQTSDRSELEATVRDVLAAHPKEHRAFAAGKTALLGFFVGQVMKLTGGKANPGAVKELIAELASKAE